MRASGGSPRFDPSRRRRRARSRLRWQRSIVAALLLVLAGGLLGLAFAGSPAKLADGVRIAGVDVGGLDAKQARMLLERRARKFKNVPVTFTAAGRRWQVKPTSLGVEVDWGAAVETARRHGAGVGPLRGLRRIEVRVFGEDIAPRVRVYDAALDYYVRKIARSLDRPHREAALALRGLRPAVVPAHAGRALDRRAAANVIVRALAGFDRRPVALPLRLDRPRVEAADLRVAAAQVKTAVSAPVRLALGPTRWRLPRWRVAELLDLPRDGRRALRIAGPGADRYFGRLQRVVDRRPVDADFAVSADGSVRVIPAKAGLSLDVPAAARAILAAAESRTNRVARLRVETKAPKLSTEAAQGMGITGLVSSFETIYGGDANRVHNVRLVAHLVDHRLIAPGATFSFNETTGERTADKGFREAPVIINGELQTGLGGGVCQVSTTVFNAAYEAGLPITARTNHSLYISHYPQGRDATVNYPNIDLRFVNDTGHWLLLRTWVGSSSLIVALYGTPPHRRVVTETGPLVAVSAPPVERVDDPSLEAGQTEIVEEGQPSRSTSVRRRVYDAEGRLLSDDGWNSSYRSEPRVIRVGTKPKPKPKPKPKAEPKPKSDDGAQTLPEGAAPQTQVGAGGLRGTPP